MQAYISLPRLSKRASSRRSTTTRRLRRRSTPPAPRSRKLFKPAALSEIPEGGERRNPHQHHQQWIAPLPSKLRLDLEVHAVNTGDQRRRQERNRSHREDLD